MHLLNKSLFRGRYLYWGIVRFLLIYSFESHSHSVLTSAKKTACKGDEAWKRQ